ncbi:unnamed protein product [Paramecium pentaurelia]|uniref:Uncharacterized protein n=1 Tax=Paramecium pentaurelia TaxID=43138 RepID=A0A8S1X7I9_9CILI|nr:unnamed protein product [Paramecium pentaurelia]
MCCSSKKPKSEIDKSQISKPPPSVINNQSQVQNQQESQLVQNQNKPMEVKEVNLMVSQIESPRSRQQKLFESKVEGFKEKYAKLQQDSTEVQFNQKPVDQLKAKLLKEQLIDLQFPNNEIKGPMFLDDNISSYKERGAEFANTLREFDGEIRNMRIVHQTPYNSYSFIGHIKDKGLYFIKCWNQVNLTKFQTFLINLGKQQQKGEQYKKYHAFKVDPLKDTDQNSPIGQMYLISTLEDHNLYSFAASTQFNIDQKLQVAHQILTYIDQTDLKSSGYGNSQFQKKIKFISPSNILISTQRNRIDVKISDWQQHLKDFNDMIPDIELKNNNYTSCSDEPDDQRTYLIKLLLLLFFRLNFNQIESFGNLDGTDQLSRFIDIKQINADSNFYKSSNFSRYIQSKINLIAQPNQEKYQKIWEEMKDKQIQELSFYRLEKREN